MTFNYRDPNALQFVPADTCIVVEVRGGRLYVPDDKGLLVQSTDWAWFNGLWRAQLDRSADGRSQ